MSEGNGRACAAAVVVCAIVLGFSAEAARGAIESRSILKSFFETGDVPTQDQFANLIDSYIHLTDDGLTLVGIGASAGSSSAARIGGNVGINELIPDVAFVSPSSHPAMAPAFAGEFGYLALKYQDAALQPHYGFLQLHMDSAASSVPGSPSVPAIHVEYWAWETTPNATATTFLIVPEPTAALSLCGLATLALGRFTQRGRGRKP